MPTSASARAAASFTPSPTITTAPVRPRLRREGGDDVPLLLRSEAADRVGGGHTELGGDARDDGGVVAREDPDADAAGAERVDGGPGVGAERVADAGDAGDAPVDGDEDRAQPLGDEGLGPRGERGRDGGTRRLDVGAVPDAHVAAVEPARDPLAGDLADVFRARTTRTERPYEARKARATACDDSASSARASWSAASSPSQRPTVARPSVSVPVLSRRTVSTCRSRSRASGSLTKIPDRAARISATDTASGTDRPSAQGQATTRRATTRSSATSGPRCSQAAPVTTARTRRAWTKRRARRSVVRSSAGRLREGLLDEGEERADAGLLAGGVDPHDEAGTEVRGAGVDGVALAHRDRLGLAGEDGVVERRAAREDDAVHRHELAGAHLDAVARGERRRGAPRPSGRRGRRPRAAARTR